MSGQWLRAKGLASPLKIDSTAERRSADKAQTKKQAFEQHPDIIEKIEIFLARQGKECKWW